MLHVSMLREVVSMATLRVRDQGLVEGRGPERGGEGPEVMMIGGGGGGAHPLLPVDLTLTRKEMVGGQAEEGQHSLTSW